MSTTGRWSLPRRYPNYKVTHVMLTKIISRLKQLRTPSLDQSLFTPLRETSREKIQKAFAGAWKDPAIPQRQLDIFVRNQLESYRKGAALPEFDILTGILKENVSQEIRHSLLEIGCSSGYYSEVLRIKGVNVEYHGCDYSDAFISLAMNLFPGIDFQVQDACALDYASQKFDIVVSGCCLLHILDYVKAFRETVRVSKGYVVFHRTPVLHSKATTYYIKKAYGVEMFEIHFNERELFRLFREQGLKVLDVITFNAHIDQKPDELSAYKTYLCEKC